MPTFSVFGAGRALYRSGLTWEGATRAAAQYHHDHGAVSTIVPERADQCRTCGRLCDQSGPICIRCQHIEDDANDRTD